MALFQRLGLIILELLERFDDALLPLDLDVPSSVPAGS